MGVNVLPNNFYCYVATIFAKKVKLLIHYIDWGRGWRRDKGEHVTRVQVISKFRAWLRVSMLRERILQI